MRAFSPRNLSMPDSGASQPAFSRASAEVRRDGANSIILDAPSGYVSTSAATREPLKTVGYVFTASPSSDLART
jgi:hypothetical protein